MKGFFQTVEMLKSCALPPKQLYTPPGTSKETKISFQGQPFFESRQSVAQGVPCELQNKTLLAWPNFPINTNEKKIELDLIRPAQIFDDIEPKKKEISYSLKHKRTEDDTQDHINESAEPAITKKMVIQVGHDKTVSTVHSQGLQPPVTVQQKVEVQPKSRPEQQIVKKQYGLQIKSKKSAVETLKGSVPQLHTTIRHTVSVLAVYVPTKFVMPHEQNEFFVKNSFAYQPYIYGATGALLELPNRKKLVLSVLHTIRNPCQLLGWKRHMYLKEGNLDPVFGAQNSLKAKWKESSTLEQFRRKFSKWVKENKFKPIEIAIGFLAQRQEHLKELEASDDTIRSQYTYPGNQYLPQITADICFFEVQKQIKLKGIPANQLLTQNLSKSVPKDFVALAGFNSLPDKVNLGYNSEYSLTLDLSDIFKADRKIDPSAICHEDLSVSTGELGQIKNCMFTWRGTSFQGSSGAVLMDKQGLYIGIACGYFDDEIKSRQMRQQEKKSKKQQEGVDEKEQEDKSFTVIDDDVSVDQKDKVSSQETDLIYYDVKDNVEVKDGSYPDNYGYPFRSPLVQGFIAKLIEENQPQAINRKKKK